MVTLFKLIFLLLLKGLSEMLSCQIDLVNNEFKLIFNYCLLQYNDDASTARLTRLFMVNLLNCNAKVVINYENYGYD
jgi:hypothetical protein